jgi:hypothetical protein
MHRLALAAALLALAPAVLAQTSYNGWNLGPDYGAMLNGMLQRDQQLAWQMRQAEAQIVQQVMQDPRAQALYQQHRAMGGQLSFPQFAYQYAATGGFTPDGIARYRASEAYNQRREQDAWAGLRQAEQERTAAMQGQRDSYWRGQYQAGLNLQGLGTWVDPNNGSRYELPYLQPGTVSRDPRTGQPFVMDQFGHYFARAPNGMWYRLEPAR